ncbi:MAG: AMP-binding protein, partial [Acidobacteria bacterium]|nr:AMP-binding protein [Acidobacteriota bacterium]
LSCQVLDRRGELSPMGAAGELCIGGEGVSRGYVGRPELTAERFVPHPFAAVPGERLYRSGDLVRQAPNGELQYLGRIDEQVKIRGFRIEPGEIQAVLESHPGVREAVVLAGAGADGAPRLAAWVVPATPPAAPPGQTAAPSPSELRQFLGERLPDYMVPAAWVTLAALPLTANGKVDRKALPAPEGESARRGYVAPRTPVEEILAGIWGELFGRERIGADDQFFELGGHSLLATRMTLRVKEVFGVELRLRAVFDAPTVAGLAAAIEGLRSAGGAVERVERVPPRRAARSGPLPLSAGQQRFWFLHQLNPESPAFHLHRAVRFHGRLHAAALAASCGEIVRRHGAVRTRFEVVAGVPCQVVDPPRPFRLPRIDLSALAVARRESELRRVAERAAQRPFRLAAEPPLRILLVRLADGEHAVLFSLHHVAGDGWSLEILARELGELYAAGVAGRPSPLPELPLQYTDWVLAQEEWLRGPAAAEQLAWWRRRLGGELPVLAFPMQRRPPAVRRFRGAAHRLAVGAELSEGLAGLAGSAGVTLFMCLLAAFSAVLHLVTGGEDLLVGTNVANRETPGVEGLVGLFVNDLALRTDLSGRPTFRQLLARVRETVLDAHAHQELPFEAILADLRPERSASPLFQVMFVLQGFRLSLEELPGLTHAALDAAPRTANFDLTLLLAPGPDGLGGAFVYDLDLFDAATIGRLAELYTVVLREMVADPDRPLDSPSFASPAAAREMVSAFSEDLAG